MIEQILHYKILFFNIVITIRWFVWMSGSRCSSFYGVAAVLGCPEHGLSLTLMLQQLKHNSHHLALLTSTVWSPQTFSKHRWMPVGAMFSIPRNSVTHLCLQVDLVIWTKKKKRKMRKERRLLVGISHLVQYKDCSESNAHNIICRCWRNGSIG